jgi:hypothetical protein
MKNKTSSRKLSRYTTLSVLLDLVRRKKLVLINPSIWEDRNDVKVILEYKKRKNIQGLFAACFCIEDETIHHWQAYANGFSGCCIEFDENKLLTSLKRIREIRWGDVAYKKLSEVNKNSFDINSYPFIKRWPYRFENEFRILWEGEIPRNAIYIDVAIDLNSINKITLNQRIPDDLSTSIKEFLRDEFRNPSMKINRSTLYENSRWIKSFTK